MGAGRLKIGLMRRIGPLRPSEWFGAVPVGRIGNPPTFERSTQTGGAALRLQFAAVAGVDLFRVDRAFASVAAMIQPRQVATPHKHGIASSLLQA